MEDKQHNGRVPVVEDMKVKVLRGSEASFDSEEKSDYPPSGANSIYAAILSRNEAVKDAKRLKTFLELRDKYVKKNVIFEDPLFPANDSSLFYSHKPAMKFEWKRPTVSPLWCLKELDLLTSSAKENPCFTSLIHCTWVEVSGWRGWVAAGA